MTQYGFGTIGSGVWNGTPIGGSSFLTSGTTYTTPADVTAITKFKFTLVGGGGGGGVTAASTNQKGTGGSSAGVAVVFLTGLAASTGYTMAIGAGGTGVSGAAGNAGTATSITINATTYTAGAGLGGFVGSASTNGPAGGTNTNATIDLPGQRGQGSTFGLGNIVSGCGGGTMMGLGGVGRIGSAAGYDAVGYGSGGGGASNSALTANAGGTGMPGMILVEWIN